MEANVVFEQKVSLSPKEFNSLASESLDDLYLKKFQAANEGQCSVHGWVVPGTSKILSRSMAQIEGGRFTGDLVSWLQVEGQVLYPVDGARLVGYVMKKNKMGLFVMYENAIQIMVARDLHIGDEEFESVQVGERVEVEIKKSRFQVRDPYILSVGLFVRKVAGPAPQQGLAKPPALEPVIEMEESDNEEEEEETNEEEEEEESEEANNDNNEGSDEEEESEEEEGSEEENSNFLDEDED
jgi:hypothetical protein